MSKQVRVIHIDASQGLIKEAHISTLEEAQALVGGYIERGLRLPNGDELFINEESALGEPKFGFNIEMPDLGLKYEFKLNGYIVGPADDDGENTDATSTVEDIYGLVTCFKIDDNVTPIRSFLNMHWTIQNEDQE